jgi:lysosomal acid lipase/cholesteryl ester hydrolase
MLFGKDDFIEQISVRNLVRNAENIHEIGKIFGYEMHDHIVTTTDGYLLTLHRIKPLRPGSPAVYLHHGLLMCSDIWCTKLNKDENLPFRLHDLGYDVWLGNNRGNKYASKHLHLKPSSFEFWDFSIDEFAMYDIPDSIQYILNLTKLSNLTYIGFSQGSAQAFAALSINSKLNTQINQFIAIAPAMTPRGLNNSLVDSLMKTSPNIMYLIFGKRSLLQTTAFWTRIIYPPLFAKVIDTSLTFLFNWRCKNINTDQKIASYSKLYSSTSVKSVVHWFQIIRNANFQMFDEVDNSLTNIISRPFQPLNFPTQSNIKTPITLIYGKIDSLVDINEMLSCLPEENVRAIGVDEFEHVDLLWGDGVNEKVFGYVWDALGVNDDTANVKVTNIRDD